ncbi:hypothetical protein [Embleya hyalina]|uniref:Uncharacterized protein n=1 Tax=Embleya hyalina TaxID=516124 RepID=A0A401YD68_9ACTN|nr:hypothetical protein [Embleya hyalina]GCD92512.1 hypothetical protein EHYA_00150 [Embleya hyalina]
MRPRALPACSAAAAALAVTLAIAPEGSLPGPMAHGTGQSGSATEMAGGCRDVAVVRPAGTAQDPDTRTHTIGFAVDPEARERSACVARASGAMYADAPDPAAPGRELAPMTRRTLRGYEPTGVAVQGGPDPARAAVLAPGNYLDEMTDKEVGYYSVDVPAGYTAYVSGTTVSKVKGLEALDVKQLGERGTSFCKTDTGLDQNLSKVVTASVRWTASGEGGNGCARPGRQVFSVTRRGTGPPVPLELQVMLEPQALDRGPAEGGIAQYTEPGGPDRPAPGGGSFASAASLPGSGHYTDTIAPGEWVFYRVRLDWGQSLSFQTRVGGGKEIVGVQTHFYNPVREQLAQDAWGVHDTEHIFAKGVDPFATRPVRFLNRSDRQQEVADMLPGWYYIAVAAQGEGESRSLAVDVSVAGTKESGPTYAQSTQPLDSARESKPPAGGTPSTGNPASKGPIRPEHDLVHSSAKDDESGAFGSPLLWAGLPAALLLGAGMTVLFLRRRGSRRT